MKKEVTIKEFVEELLSRIENTQDINCCKTEIKVFADYVTGKIGEDKILIDWKSSPVSCREFNLSCGRLRPPSPLRVSPVRRYPLRTPAPFPAKASPSLELSSTKTASPISNGRAQ